MEIRLYNTLSKRKEVFTPLDPERVTMYVCGPTVYSYAHIGNARPPVVFDVLARLLRHCYPKLVYARNFTDVDDKIIAAAAKLGEPISTITERYTEIYLNDMRSLGVIDPDIDPRATENIDAMVEMIGELIDSGNAYAAEGHVLFAVESYSGYGELSKRSLKEMIAGARVEVAPYKRHPADFVLWKPSTDDQPGWDSPWGRGRPGWHIECSAMIRAHLGQSIDIHGGGIDLAFPHHENERAQSCCAAPDREFVRYWMHNGFLTLSNDKMAKSLGNIITVNDLRGKVDPEIIRLVLMSAHYRQPLDWCDSAVRQARERLDRMYRALDELSDVELADGEAKPTDDFLAALADDLNTPKALAVLAEYVGACNTSATDSEHREAKARLIGCGQMIGLLNRDPREWFTAGGDDDDGLSDADIDALLAERQQARADRNFARADEIRDQLKDANIIIDDTPQGPRWRRQQG